MIKRSLEINSGAGVHGGLIDGQLFHEPGRPPLKRILLFIGVKNAFPAVSGNFLPYPGFPRPGIPTFVGISYRFPTDFGSNSQTSDSNSRERANPTDFL